MSRRALVVGIDYEADSRLRLNGCVNDAEAVCAALTDMDHVTVLTGDQPTRRNIEDAMREEVRAARADSEVFFFYAGHGTYARDHGQDEVDGKDEALVPLDVRTAGIIRDDQIHAWLNRFPSTARITVMIDCCHSATMLDLPYRMVRGPCRRASRRRPPTVSPNVVCISGCRDFETAQEVRVGGHTRGALTYTVLRLLAIMERYNVRLSVSSFLYYLRKWIPSKQIPQITSSRPYSGSDKLEFDM